VSLHPGLNSYFTLLHEKSVANEAGRYRQDIRSFGCPHCLAE
jgi:hypothetical protein